MDTLEVILARVVEQHIRVNWGLAPDLRPQVRFQNAGIPAGGALITILDEAGDPLPILGGREPTLLRFDRPLTPEEGRRAFGERDWGILTNHGLTEQRQAMRRADGR